MPWTPEDFKELAAKHLTAASQNPESFHKGVTAFLFEALEHYDDATPEGKAHLDGFLTLLTGMFQSALDDMPDSAETRKMKRLLASLKGTHFMAQDLFESFPTIGDPESDRVTKAFRLLERATQVLMDILHDATRSTHQGPSKFAIVGLYFWLLDEVTVAQYLARRSYSTLAYTNLRSCMEIIDKVELFTKKPEEANIWVSGDEHAIWKKLAPARVRVKLGKNTFDPLYQYFSEQGSHSTFTALQSRVRRRNKAEGENLKISILFGGIVDEPRQLSILLYLVMLVNVATVRAIAAFEGYLHPGDLASLVIPITDETFATFDEFLAEGWDIGKVPLASIKAAWEKIKTSGVPHV